MIRVDDCFVIWSLNVVTPFLKGSDHTKKFSVVNLIIPFCQGKGPWNKGTGMSISIDVELCEDGSWCPFRCITFDLEWFCLVFESPVPRLEKDRDWTGPRPEKTGPAVQVFDFWESKTGKRPVFMDRSLRLRPVWTGEFVPLIYPFKRSARSPKTVNIWLRNKINYAMLTKIVDFAEYYCIKFNSQPYLMFLGSF